MRMAVLTLDLCRCFAAVDHDQLVLAITATKLPEGTRFEIVQPAWDSGTPCRLDRFSGQVHRLANCPSDDSTGSRLCWKEMQVIDRPRGGAAAAVNYQMLVLNPQKLILLMRLDSGAMWQY